MERDLERMVVPVVQAAGLDLVEVTFRREAGGKVLRITVDREDGVDLDTIAEASERVSRRLDVEGFDPGPYRLEVSSPGLDRPLRRPADFVRRIGERIKVRTAEPGGEAAVLVGTLVAAGDEGASIATEEGERRVAYQDMVSARTVVDWNEELKKRSTR